eukprot:3193485-Karenia_brevis.AAC.1
MLERQMNKYIAELHSIDIGEIYSPKRVNEYAHQFGLEPGWSLDLTTRDEQGQPWDFTKVEMRNKAIRRVINERPLFVIGSPP